MKHYQFIFVLLTLCVIISCRHIEDENHHYTITFYNKSDKEVYISESAEYPDTINVVNYHVLGMPEIYKIFPQGINKTACEIRETYETFFKYRNDTLMIYVFDAEVLERNQRYNYDAVLQRLDVSLKDLQRLNWIITYPPTEAMKDIKMYPPYDTYR